MDKMRAAQKEMENTCGCREEAAGETERETTVEKIMICGSLAREDCGQQLAERTKKNKKSLLPLTTRQAHIMPRFKHFVWSKKW